MKVEEPPLALKRGPISKQPNLEMIPKLAFSQEREGTNRMPMPLEEIRSVTLEIIPKVNEQKAQELWEKVHQNAMENCSNDDVSSPFYEMDLGLKTN